MTFISALKTSEFWVALSAAILTAFQSLGLVPALIFGMTPQSLVTAAIVYIFGRLAGKTAKSVAKAFGV